MSKQFELKQYAYTSGLKSRALSVFIYLIDRSNKELTYFPAMPTIARELHISVSTVKRALRELVSTGFVVKENRFREHNHGQTSNLYTLQFSNNTLINDNDNDQSKADEIYDTNNEIMQNEVEHITFETIAEEDTNNTPIHEDIIEPKKTIDITDKITDTPAQINPLITIYMKMIIPTCRSMLKKFILIITWTGEGVNLIPP